MAATMRLCMSPNVKHLSAFIGHSNRCQPLVSCRNAHYSHNHLAQSAVSYVFGFKINLRHYSGKQIVSDEILKDKSFNDENKQDQGDRGSDEEPKKEKKPWTFKIAGREYKVKTIAKSALAIYSVSLLTFVIYTWGEPEINEYGEIEEDEYTDYNAVLARILRAKRAAFHQVQVTQEPSRDKLLPAPLSYPYIQPPYTLVLEMKDVLVHPEWEFMKGWRFKKRPGIDHFLRAIGPPLFEVVIFTKESGMTADPLITKIDPENYIMYRLYRDATRYEKGIHIKDLRYLNRDLSKVIMVDFDKKSVKYNRENSLILKPWTGQNNDVVLGELAEFLRAMAASNVDDVRPVLQYYSNFEDPMAQFRENQQKLLEDERQRQAQVEQQKQKNLSSSVWSQFKR